MRTFQNIVLTTDFSTNSDAAIPFAVALAKQNGGTIHLFHSFEEDPATTLASGGLTGPSPWFRTLRKTHEEKLAEVARSASAIHGIQFQPASAAGHPAQEIVRYAASVQADVIVIATHGRAGLSHLLLGSIAEKVMRLSSVPVLTVRPGENIPHGGLRFATIVLPTDFSKNSEEAIPYAVGLAKRDGGRLVLVHSVEDSTYYSTAGASEGIGPDIEQWMATITAGAQKQLVALSEQITKDHGVPVEFVLRRGRAFEQLDEIARDYKADLIVISTHGYTGLSHLVFGSVAEKVVRGSPCPVLSIRPPKTAE